MIKEFRFKGISAQGKLVQSTFTADSPKAAKAHLNKLLAKYQLKLKSFEAKKVFLYSVRLSKGKKVTGKQAAFSKEEVALALQRMGYADYRITPEFFNIRGK